MKLVSRDYVISLKQERRRNLPLEYHVNGDCIHIGKISPGCRTCFDQMCSTFHVYSGVQCNLNCPVCYYSPHRTDKEPRVKEILEEQRKDLDRLFKSPHFKPEIVSYSCEGESLLYPWIIKEYSNLFKENRPDQKIYFYIYTNGLLADQKMLDFLKECNISEIRFHISASGFSEKVFYNMMLAKDMGFIITVEEPGLPENRDRLIHELPRLDDIGVKHIDIVEVRLSRWNFPNLDKTYPDGLAYQDPYWAMYDDGMVYDIIEEKVKNKYNFSVIDCNIRTEMYRGDIISPNSIYNLEEELHPSSDILEAIATGDP